MIGPIALHEELEALEGKLRVVQPAGEDLDEKHMAEITPQQWTAMFGKVTPRQLYERFSRAAGPGNRTCISVELPVMAEPPYTLDVPPRIEIRHNTTWDDGHYENNICFCLPGNGTAELEAAYFRPEDRNQHLVTRYLSTAVDMLKDAGYKQLDCEALETGAYAWLKYGFKPDNARSAWLLRNEILMRLDQQGNVRMPLSRRMDDSIPDTLAFDASAEAPFIRKLLDASPDELPERFHHLAELRREVGEFNGHTMTVGKALLFNSRWMGTLKLDEHDRGFQRFKQYVGQAEEQLKGRGA